MDGKSLDRYTEGEYREFNHAHNSTKSQKFPTPQSLCLQIMENSTVGTHVTTVSALSRSALIYDITRGNEEHCFFINHHTGVISTRKLLDFEVCQYLPFQEVGMQICTICQRSALRRMPPLIYIYSSSIITFRVEVPVLHLMSILCNLVWKCTHHLTSKYCIFTPLHLSVSSIFFISFLSMCFLFFFM